MTSFYYLYKYGTNGNSMLNANGGLYTNNFIGSYLQYNRFDTADCLDFITAGNQNGTQDNDGYDDGDINSFTDFYSAYKTIAGSDYLSHVNSFTNTSSMALGDLVNIESNGHYYSDNLDVDPKKFYFRATQDADPYRYTSFDGSAAKIEALKDYDGATPINFDDLQAAADDYYAYKVAVSTSGATVPTLKSSISLTTLGINYSQVMTQATTTDEAKAIYQNLINQLVAEATAIKPGTMSQEDIIAAERELAAKQKALKAIDDAIYGYTESTSSYDQYEDVTMYQGEWILNFASKTPPTTGLQTIYDAVDGKTGTLDASEITDLYNTIGALDIKATDTSAATITQTTQMAIMGAIQQKVEGWVNDAAKAGAQPINFEVTTTDPAVQAQVIDEINKNSYLSAMFDSEYSVGHLSTRAAVVTFVDTLEDGDKNTTGVKLFDTLDATQKNEAVNILWAKAQKKKYIDDISTAIYNDSINSSTIQQTNYIEKVKITEGIVNDITTRTLDNNYSPSKEATIRIKLVPFLKSIKYGGGDLEAYNMALAAEGLGLDIKNLTTGATYPGGSWGAVAECVDTAEEGAMAHLLIRIATGEIVPTYNESTGIYSFTYGGQNFEMNSNLHYAGQTADNIFGEIANHLNAMAGGVGQDGWAYSIPNCNSRDMGNLIIEQAQKWTRVEGNMGTMEMRHIKASDTTKGGVLESGAGGYNTDENSLVFELAKSILETGTVTAVDSSTSDKDKMGFAIYLSEVSAAIMEQYYIENLHNSNPEAIDAYFDREMRAYLNPTASQNVTTLSYINSYGKIKKFNVNFSEDAKVVTTIDKIIGTQSWAKMITKIEDRSRAEMALFEEAAALDTVVNVNTKEFQYRMALLAELEKEANTSGSDIQKLGLNFSKVSKNLVEQGAGAEKNPWWSEYFPWFKGYYGTMPEGATPDEMFDDNGNLRLRYSAGAALDPYIVKINNVDYVMGVDRNQDGNITDAQEILGIEDTIETTFASLVALDKDQDGYVSQEELKSQNIILKAVNKDQKLNGSTMDIGLVKGIDLATLKEGDGTNNVYGLFNVQLSNGQTAAAAQTFEKQSYFNNLFGTYADMSFLKKDSATPAATANATTTAKSTMIPAKKYVNTLESTAEETEENTNTPSSKFNFFTYLSKTNNEENKTETETETETKEETLVKIEEAKTVSYNNKDITIDKLIDELCWKSGIDALSGKQRYDILGSVDMSQDSDIIIRKVQEKVSKFHTEFSA